MTDDNEAGGRRRNRMVAGAGLLVAGALAGGILAGTFSASAADGGSSTTPGTTATANPSAPTQRDMFGPAPVRSDEKALSDSVAAKVRAAALEAVPGGTVYRVETDADGATYEAHMKKSDGTLVTVKLDKSFAVTATEDGMGAGGPGDRGPGGHGPGGPAPQGGSSGQGSTGA